MKRFKDFYKPSNNNWILHAVHGESGIKVGIGTFKTPASAAKHVEKLDFKGSWPEGHDAVITHKKTGKKYMYTDNWEPLVISKKRNNN